MPFFAKSDASWGGTLGEEEAIVHGGKQTSQSNNTPTKSYNPIESDCMAGCTLMPPQPFPLLTHPCLVGGGRGGGFDEEFDVAIKRVWHVGISLAA